MPRFHLEKALRLPQDSAAADLSSPVKVDHPTERMATLCLFFIIWEHVDFEVV
jgi:hypothetical protein